MHLITKGIFFPEIALQLIIDEFAIISKKRLISTIDNSCIMNMYQNGFNYEIVLKRTLDITGSVQLLLLL